MTKRMIYPMLAGAALVVMTACGGATPNASPAANVPVSGAASTLPRDINVTEASKQRDAGAFVLDVRETYEWNEGHIPNATLIPLGTLPNQLASVPKDKPIVVICRSGNRSQTGRDILLKAGFTNVTSVNGGMIAWEAARLPVTK
ncbi:MAG: rhodanese-like domain-containing protein [Anaerolineae bacterium]|nr:rhodanese-like domain-containing protein [Anaerolineae bacterium]